MNHKSQLFCSCRPMKSALLAEWGRVATECWTGTFQVSITGCRKFLSTIPVLFVVVEGCVVTLHPVKAWRWQSNGGMQPAGTDNGDLCREKKNLLCWVHFLFPASRPGTKSPLTVSNCPARFTEELWRRFRPERRPDFMNHICSLQAGEVLLGR